MPKLVRKDAFVLNQQFAKILKIAGVLRSMNRYRHSERLRWPLACMLLALCVRCGGSTGHTEAPGSRPTGNDVAPKTSDALLYVADQGDNEVHMYSYPEGKAAGTLTGLGQPAGLCPDAAKDVWIVESSSSRIVEFARGGRTPIAALSDPNATQLMGCSVDPASGDLAVTEWGGGNAAGSISVYPKASGTPKRYSDKGMQEFYYCAYDDAGNLFVDGVDAQGAFRFDELAHGAKTLRTITINDTVEFPGGVQWDGKYIAVGTQQYQGAHQSAIFEVSVSGSKGTVKGTVRLDGSCDVENFWIPKLGNGSGNPQGTKVVAADACLNEANVYNYPTSGPATKTFSGLQHPVGAVVTK